MYLPTRARARPPGLAKFLADLPRVRSPADSVGKVYLFFNHFCLLFITQITSLALNPNVSMFMRGCLSTLDDQSDLADTYFEQLTTLATFKLVRGANFVIFKFCDGARRHSIFRDSNFPRS